jgi:hypothetical protein
MEAKVLKVGDECPQCGGTLKPARVPTDAEFAHASDRENPVALPGNSDSASPEQRKELGALHRCMTCGYQARFQAKTPAAAPQPVL